MNSKIPHYSVMVLFLSLVWASFLSGCSSTIDPGAFQRFAESTVELRDGADEVFEQQYKMARERFEMEVTQGDSLSEINIQKLLIENVPGKPFAWKTQEPPLLFFAARQFRETFGALNDALVKYADLLVELSTSGNISEDEFNAAASGINSGIRDAVAAFGENSQNREISIFSVGATTLFQEYLNSENKQTLRSAILENQENIQALSDHLSKGLQLASRHAFTEYSVRSFDLAMMLTPDSQLTTVQKRERLVELIELDEQYINRLETIRRLNDSYRALPGANRELSASLDNKESGLGSIQRISDNAKRIYKLFKELETPVDDVATK